MLTEKHVRRAIREELRLALVKSKVGLKEEASPDKNFDPETSGIQMPAQLKKLLDPETTPAKREVLRQQIDDKGNEVQLAVIIAATALSYADNDEALAKKLLQRALRILPKMMAKADTKDVDNPDFTLDETGI